MFEFTFNDGFGMSPFPSKGKNISNKYLHVNDIIAAEGSLKNESCHFFKESSKSEAAVTTPEAFRSLLLEQLESNDGAVTLNFFF